MQYSVKMMFFVSARNGDSSLLDEPRRTVASDDRKRKTLPDRICLRIQSYLMAEHLANRLAYFATRKRVTSANRTCPLHAKRRRSKPKLD